MPIQVIRSGRKKKKKNLSLFINQLVNEFLISIIYVYKYMYALPVITFFHGLKHLTCNFLVVCIYVISPPEQ